MRNGTKLARVERIGPVRRLGAFDCAASRRDQQVLAKTTKYRDIIRIGVKLLLLVLQRSVQVPREVTVVIEGIFLGRLTV